MSHPSSWHSGRGPSRHQVGLVARSGGPDSSLAAPPTETPTRPTHRPGPWPHRGPPLAISKMPSVLPITFFSVPRLDRIVTLQACCDVVTDSKYGSCDEEREGKGARKNGPRPRRTQGEELGVTKIAILDDYIGVAMDYGDWSVLPDDTEITVYREPIPPERLVEELRELRDRPDHPTAIAVSPSRARGTPEAETARL